LTKGTIILIHKESCTFILEVHIDSFVGEVSFFSGKPRKATARSKNFTEVLALYKQDYISCAEKYPEAFEIYD
jgi:hypothetical protein